VYAPTTPLLLPTSKEGNPSERRMRWGWEIVHLPQMDEGKAKKFMLQATEHHSTLFSQTQRK
jgi:hypothetical protein